MEDQGRLPEESVQEHRRIPWPRFRRTSDVPADAMVQLDEPPDEVGRKHWLTWLFSNRRALAIMSGALVAVGLVGIGFGFGWTAASRQDAPYSGPDVIEVPVPQYDAQAQALMPDVRGLAQSEAESALADAGIPAAIVQVSSREAAGVAGLVVEQTPRFGAENPTEVSLLVSAPATVPDLVGQPERAASEVLLALGARVDRSQRYVAGTAPGLVVEVQPVAGSPLGDAVSMTVSEPAASIYLNQIERISGGCSSARESMNGREYPQSLTCSATSKPQLSEWLINRAGTDFVGTLGVPDKGPVDAAVSIRILADGVEVGSYSASYGAPVEFRVPVAGTLRLGVEVTAVNLPERPSNSWSAVLGDARLEGSSVALAALADKP